MVNPAPPTRHMGAVRTRPIRRRCGNHGAATRTSGAVGRLLARNGIQCNLATRQHTAAREQPDPALSGTKPHQRLVQFPLLPGVVPNRGVANQSDLGLFGLHYLQQVSDADKPPFATAGQALHIEPGLFMNVPPSRTSKPGEHRPGWQHPDPGVSLLMQGPTPSATAPVPGPRKHSSGLPYPRAAGVHCARQGHWASGSATDIPTAGRMASSTLRPRG